MNYKTFKERILSNQEVRKEYEKNRLSFEVAQMVIEARIIKKMSQKELAKRVGTKQPSIARVESGDSLVSLRLLKKIADALGTEIKIQFSKYEQNPPITQYHILFGFDAPLTGNERKAEKSESYDYESESLQI
ncbi:MAG TPA: helix-turn-helix transcriptional regulator [Candidatus Paceibacterota bacterium]